MSARGVSSSGCGISAYGWGLRAWASGKLWGFGEIILLVLTEPPSLKPDTSRPEPQAHSTLHPAL